MKTTNTAWCFDTTDKINDKPHDLSVYGQSETEPHRRLDLSFIPCKPTLKVRGQNQDGVNCLIDAWTERAFSDKLAAAKAYIGYPNINVLTNRQSLHPKHDDFVQVTDIFNK